jgi:hypothetical protein
MKPTFLLLAVVLVTAPAAAQTVDKVPVRSTPFPDVPVNHWAYDAVEQLRKAGIVRGYPPGQSSSPQAPRAPKKPSARK